MAKPPGVANGQLTDMQRAFVHALVANGMKQTDAAKEAGYAEPRVSGYQLRRLPHVQAAVAAEIRSQLSGDLSVKAINRLSQILDDDTAEPKIWLDAAKVVLDRGGFVAPKAAEASSGSLKDMNEMSIDELNELLSKLKSERANAATIIDLDATEVVDAQQPI